jgi:hypothetical protein
MKKKQYNQHAGISADVHKGFLTEDYVWATSEESRQDARTLQLMGSIAHKYGGTVRIDPGRDSVNIDVPEEKRLACAEELGEKVDISV